MLTKLTFFAMVLGSYGAATGQVAIKTSVSTNQDIALATVTANPVLTLSSSSLNFGSDPVGTVLTRSVTLSSTGTSPVTISAASIAGTGFFFSGATFPVTLNPTIAITVQVKFYPTAIGTASGKLTFSSNSSSGATSAVSLSGTGTAAQHQVSLRWAAPTNSPVSLMGYNIYRATGSSTSFQLLNSSEDSQTSYVDTTVLASTAYTYYVTSVDNKGTQSGPSNKVTVTVPASTSTLSLTTPAPGSKLSGSTATFAWSNPGSLATRFVLRLGTTGVGSSNVYNGAVTAATSVPVSGIPANGAYLYAVLWYYLNGKWQYFNATYTEAGTPTPPALTTPAPGSTLPGSTVTFGWNPGKGPTRFVLRLGTTGLGSSDVYNGASTTGTSVQLTTVPTHGAKLYARLWYYLDGKWLFVDAIYKEAIK